MTPEFKDILYTVAGGIGTITINRPQKLNSVTAESLREIEVAFDLAGKDPEVGVVVFIAPRGTPRPMVDKLYRETAAAIQDAPVRTRFIDFGAEPLSSMPDELGRYIAAEVVKWREIIGRGGIAIDP